jgi:hypothetical protein
MSDTEQEWKPNPRRPQSYVNLIYTCFLSMKIDLVIFRLQYFNRLTRIYSTMAQAFSLALDSAFMLDNEVNDLTQSIELK